MSEAYIRALPYACQALSLTYNQTAILYVIPLSQMQASGHMVSDTLRLVDTTNGRF